MMKETQQERKMIVVGLGEVLWDLLPGGKQLGGASANFAYHAQNLGAAAKLVSTVGDDVLGKEMLEKLGNMQMAVDCITVHPTAPTGTVSIALTGNGQPSYAIRENVAWDYITPNELARATVAQADAVCFGSLAQRHAVSRAAIRSLLASTRPAAYRVFDVNLRQNFFSSEVIESSLQLANILKISDEEFPVLAGMLGLPAAGPEQLAELARRFNLELVALTRGAKGSVFYSPGHYSEVKSVPVKVVDTVGAGDSFTAAMVMGLLAGWDLDRINYRANEVAAYVVSQPGATPKLPARFASPPEIMVERRAADVPS